LRIANGGGRDFVTSATVDLNMGKEMGGYLSEEWVAAKMGDTHRASAAELRFLFCKLLSCGLF
jgi:hypothetical protein